MPTDTADARKRMDEAWKQLQLAQREYTESLDAWMEALALSVRPGSEKWCSPIEMAHAANDAHANREETIEP